MKTGKENAGAELNGGCHSMERLVGLSSLDMFDEQLEAHQQAILKENAEAGVSMSSETVRLLARRRWAKNISTEKMFNLINILGVELISPWRDILIEAGSRIRKSNDQGHLSHPKKD